MPSEKTASYWHITTANTASNGYKEVVLSKLSKNDIDFFKMENYPIEYPVKTVKYRSKTKSANQRESEIIMSKEELSQNKEDIFSSFKLEVQSGKTFLVLVVKNELEPDKNTYRNISCNYGRAFSNGYAYDQASDSYSVPCIYHMDLGSIPVAYRLVMEDAGWGTQLPMPEAVIQRYLSGNQRTHINEVVKKYSGDRYSIRYIQMYGCEL